MSFFLLTPWVRFSVWWDERIVGTWRRMRIAALPGVEMRGRCHVARGVRVVACDGGRIVLGDGVSLGRGATLVASGGQILLGARVHIGLGVMITAIQRCEIGDDALIAEYVVIRDQDHSTAKRPISTAGFVSAPIHIGRDVWLGAKATVLKGVTLGDECVVGAHALVRRDAPPRSLIVGVPARARPLPSNDRA